MPLATDHKSARWPALRVSGPGAGEALEASALLSEAEQLLSWRDSRALGAFERAALAGADPARCAGGRWMAHMLRGDFRSAWRESDTIRAHGFEDPHRFWDGTSIDGRRLIVRCLHGFGDAVQFLRYLPSLRTRAAEVIVETSPRLVELARCIEGADHVLSWEEKTEAWDCQMEVMELPYFFRTELSDLPIATSYLKIPDEYRHGVGAVMGASRLPRVGIVWTAGSWNPSRSSPLDMWRNLLTRTDAEFWSLQGGEACAEWDLLPKSENLRDARICGDGLMALAATISQLDLIITVDTLAAHLAGAVGRPAWVLLEYAADWRWMTGRSDSPWYPTLRLFRQPTRGDWASVFASVGRSFDQWMRGNWRPR